MPAGGPGPEVSPHVPRAASTAAPDRRPAISLAATVSVYGAEDSELSGDCTPRLTSQGVPLGELYSGTDVGLSYIPGRRGAVDLDFRGASGFRYYPGLSDAVAATQSATAGVGIALTRRTALHTRGGLSYSPYIDYSQPVGLDAERGGCAGTHS